MTYFDSYHNPGLPPGEEDVDWHWEDSKCDIPTLKAGLEKDGGMQPCGIQWDEPVAGPETRNPNDPNPAVRPCPWHRLGRTDTRPDLEGDE